MAAVEDTKLAPPVRRIKYTRIWGAMTPARQLRAECAASGNKTERETEQRRLEAAQPSRSCENSRGPEAFMSPPPPCSGWEAYLVDPRRVPSHAAWSLRPPDKGSKSGHNNDLPSLPRGALGSRLVPRAPEAGSDCHIRYRK